MNPFTKQFWAYTGLGAFIVLVGAGWLMLVFLILVICYMVISNGLIPILLFILAIFVCNTVGLVVNHYAEAQHKSK